MYDLLIIGGGPAGLTAAIYAIRKRLNMMLVANDLGGKTQYQMCLPWIQDYERRGIIPIRGLEVVNKFKSEVEYLKDHYSLTQVEKVEKKSFGFSVHTEKLGTLEARALVIATGARQNMLGIPGERDYMGRGISFSALSYAPLFIDRKVALIGDGDLALRSAAELAIHASEVYFICDCRGIMASPLGDKLSKASNVKLLLNHTPVAFKGDEFLKSVVLETDGGQEEIEVEGAFIERQLIPNSEMVKGLVEMDLAGRIRVDCTTRTSTPGVFAAGDVTTSSVEQVLIAVGDGAKAALNAYDYLLPML